MGEKCDCKCKSEKSDCGEKLKPQKLTFSFADWLKALYSWIRAFRKTFIIKPGLYFTGENYDINSSLLVTANYHMTVFNLFRKLKGRNVRILVIDTAGINVWCSSGKGKFSAENIAKHLAMYDREILSSGEKIEVILPKLSLSGVSLKALREKGVKPIIGPVYAHQSPDYLDSKPHKSRNNDKYLFSLKDRMFTVPSSMFQILTKTLIFTAGLFLWNYFTGMGITWQALAIVFFFSLSYIVLFPALPTKTFAIKSIPLAFVMIFFLILDFKTGRIFVLNVFALWSLILFTAAFALYFALYYTGNSGVSNYSLVKKEIIRFLPISIITFLFSIAVLVIGEFV